MPSITLESDSMDSKIINVSKKRQITIPLKFFNKLNIENEVECSLENGAIIIRPLRRKSEDFSVEILKDLISQGYSDDELIKQFEHQTKVIKTSIVKMLEEADQISSGEIPAASFEDVFGSEDK